MNAGEIPGYEFEVPPGPRQGGGPRHARPRRAPAPRQSVPPRQPLNQRPPVRQGPPAAYGPPGWGQQPPSAQSPVAQSPAAQRPVTQRPVTQRPVTQRPVAQGSLVGQRPRPAAGRDSMRDLQQAPPAEPSPRSLRAISRGVLAVMRTRNWLMGLAAPILAAVTVGIAAVVVTGGGGSGAAAPSALAAGFPPARLAGAQFAAGGGTRGLLAAHAAGA